MKELNKEKSFCYDCKYYLSESEQYPTVGYCSLESDFIFINNADETPACCVFEAIKL